MLTYISMSISGAYVPAYTPNGICIECKHLYNFPRGHEATMDIICLSRAPLSVLKDSVSLLYTQGKVKGEKRRHRDNHGAVLFLLSILQLGRIHSAALKL